ncbi:MAG TPA: thioesterase family protein [Acidimicrobiales bacterium]|nr:thioesterase family protein [Acidimicrobiales bacterium]
MGDTAFERQTAVRGVPGARGRYRAELTDQWSAPVLPQGGVTTAVALRAMAAELGVDTHTLRSVTTVFVAQVPPGPVHAEVTVLRRGRTMSQAVATVSPAGSGDGPALGHTAIAVFGDRRTGFEFTELAMPAVAPPLECPSFRDPLPEGVQGFRPATYWERVESRVAVGHAPWDDWEPTGSERVYWYRFDEPPVDDDGRWDTLSLVTLCDTMPGAVGERLGPGAPNWYGPSADITVHILGTATSEWLLARNRAHVAGDGYASLETVLWDPARGPVAFATQMAFFTFADGEPPAEQLRPPPVPPAPPDPS